MSDNFYGINGNKPIDRPLRRMLTLWVSIPTFIVGDPSTAVVLAQASHEGLSCNSGPEGIFSG